MLTVGVCVCACFALEGRCFVLDGCCDTDLVPFKATSVICVAFFTNACEAISLCVANSIVGYI